MRLSKRRQPWQPRVCGAISGLAGLLAAAPALALSTPEIRMSAENPVPACVTPDRLMSFLKNRNNRLDPRFRDIAKHYKNYGEAWRVRWDYAFFQMAVETNFLTYRTGTGRMGDVDPKQNNFAGIGTTGGGVPGDSFPDVKTGVHAQIQHLVVYSGERLAKPIAPRTQLKQDEILKATSAVGHPMRFADLARRWAVDKAYGSSIEWVANSYRETYCRGKQPAAPALTKEVLPWSKKQSDAGQQPASRPAVAEPRLASAPKRAARPSNPAVRTVWERGQPAQPVAVAPAPAPEQSVPRYEVAAAPHEPAAAADSVKFDPAVTPPSGLGALSKACSVASASYGGRKAVLIRTEAGGAVKLTALKVLDGFEGSMTANFIAARAPGGVSVGEFASEAEALAKAREMCALTSAQ